MALLNPHYQKLQSGYLFQEIEKRVSAYQKAFPENVLLNLGIGDVSEPLTPTLLKALVHASSEMGDPQTFRGYGPSQGYAFLREKIAEQDFQNRITPDEIFISDGAKNDVANLQEIFCTQNQVGLADPVYPVYIDTTVMAGRTGPFHETKGYEGIHYLPCTEETGFEVLPPKAPLDLIYLCSPNNPTGVAFSKNTLKKWIAYAKEHQAVLLFDAAYEAYITDPNIPHSIYEIEGGKEVAIEIRSFSKTAGFTGLRCSYTVVPKDLQINKQSLHALWSRRHGTKFGGVSYPIQRTAEAVYSKEGHQELKTRITCCMQGAKAFKASLQKQGFTVFGGENAPYVWCKTPNGLSSWDFFDTLLTQASILSIPGSGFGRRGEGYIRFSAFAPQTTLQQATKALSCL